MVPNMLPDSVLIFQERLKEFQMPDIDCLKKDTEAFNRYKQGEFRLLFLKIFFHLASLKVCGLKLCNFLQLEPIKGLTQESN